ncbi:UDP-N-acetylmuramoyl-tripeptide--D-alanyl-D-alanine ligase [Xenorhabdus nematophila]|uniref:UDP-N-acetylmuramoyl-tripeptide--D-alanyl-D-alanine ligase n=1 Tax=Xenorhabdus nematophila (strain ATCC 19061 / DSM 3370 / CCUG 14189 / LMG 1036 / NCIMB 9965 / AN6) TaxID=406817 RepID=D3V8S6_XENNA|nr:UDP-N-acetylmuramoyl-tripeptide--D-alanyl-D-alanine ligase [Xenorhabdus nematophila]CBJ89124.1 D-alanine:D-alanine-adding enzyme [Xenorhabdus nematophila ATCC 19061]CEK22032.1 D-alanine:D-alanine-adding enzyme [Xenorhabdus nematophila AN6/1]
MIPLTVQQLSRLTEGTLYHVTEQQAAALQINTVKTDSRKIVCGGLFIALKGEKFDAHDFAADVVKQGAGALLVSRRLDIDCPQVVVKDTRLAMGKLAGWVRQQSKARVVALTGSSGKTSVKEMTAAILRQCGNTLYTAGNFNNDIGVPLTLFRLTEEHQFAVIELGANHIGEIAYTTAMTRPESALVNNLFSAHLEGFGSLAGVAKAKGEIFAGLAPEGTAIINLDSNDWGNWQHGIREQQRVWHFSVTPAAGADFYATDIVEQPLATHFCLHTPIGKIELILPLPGRHNVANALAASALAISVGASLEDICAGLSALKAVPGRLFPIHLSAGKTVLDDTYNANTGSMIAAANVLSQMSGYRVMVVGDMGELGKQAAECHREVGKAVATTNIDKVFSVGTLSSHISDASGRGQHFANKTELVAALLPLLEQHEMISILIKGSRSTAMEEVVNALKENFQC